jgi:hypothetical protein
MPDLETKKKSKRAISLIVQQNFNRSHSHHSSILSFQARPMMRRLLYSTSESRSVELGDLGTGIAILRQDVMTR